MQAPRTIELVDSEATLITRLDDLAPRPERTRVIRLGAREFQAERVHVGALFVPSIRQFPLPAPEEATMVTAPSRELLELSRRASGPTPQSIECDDPTLITSCAPDNAAPSLPTAEDLQQPWALGDHPQAIMVSQPAKRLSVFAWILALFTPSGAASTATEATRTRVN